MMKTKLPLFALVLLASFLLSACLNSVTPKGVFAVLNVPEGFRGPLQLVIDPGYFQEPRFSGLTVHYDIPESRVLRLRTTHMEEGTKWDRFSVRYPSGKTIRAVDFDGHPDDGDYLFMLGDRKMSGGAQLALFVGNKYERREFEDIDYYDMKRCMEIWAEVQAAQKKRKAPLQSQGKS